MTEDTDTSFDVDSLPEVSVDFGAIGAATVIGWIVLGPVGLLAGLIAYVTSKKKQEEELRSQLGPTLTPLSPLHMPA